MGKDKDTIDVKEISEEIRAELTSCSSSNTILRTDSTLTRRMSAVAVSHGRDYVRYLLRPLLKNLGRIRLSGDSRRERTFWVTRKRSFSVEMQALVEHIAHSQDHCPRDIRALCGALAKQVHEKFPDHPDCLLKAVAGLLFLRLLCPAIVDPARVGFPAHSADNRKIAVLAAKTLQSLASPDGRLQDSTIPQSQLLSMHAQLQIYMLKIAGAELQEGSAMSPKMYDLDTLVDEAAPREDTHISVILEFGQDPGKSLDEPLRPRQQRSRAAKHDGRKRVGEWWSRLSDKAQHILRNSSPRNPT